MTDIQSLLTRYISGEAAPEEAEIVEAWISASPDNRREFEQQWKIMEMTSHHSNYLIPNIKNEWSGMQSKLQQLNRIAPKIKPSYKIFRYKIIYVIAGLAVIGSILIKSFSQKKIAVITHYSKENLLIDTLPEGTLAFLDKHSSISYNNKNLNDKNPVIIKGSVYFKEAKNQQDTIVLKAGTLDIIPYHADIYVSFDTIVQVAFIHVQSGNAVIKNDKVQLAIAQGESVQFDEKVGKPEKNEHTNINVYSYATKIFDFNDMPLKEAVGYLEKAYGVSIKLQEIQMGNCRITTRFDDKTLKEVLDIMAYTLNFQYKYYRETNQVLLLGKGCE
jgi:transmembrane sensor